MAGGKYLARQVNQECVYLRDVAGKGEERLMEARRRAGVRLGQVSGIRGKTGKMRSIVKEEQVRGGQVRLIKLSLSCHTHKKTSYLCFFFFVCEN